MDDYEHAEKATKVECDRLSGLPDDLIYRILFFVGMKHAVQTSLLSSRWRLFWTSMPYLDFSSVDFSEGYKFSNFVTNVLSRRNNHLKTSSVNLTFGGTELSGDDARKIIRYAFTHYVQQMTMKCLYGLYSWDSVFINCCQSLKHLTLVGCIKSASVILPSVWDLPVLTTLHLKDVRIEGKTTTSVGLFCKCVNLKSLTISNFDMSDETNVVTICHPQLSNITLEDGTWRSEYLRLVTPQLKNLTVRNCEGELLISAPDQLTTLKYKSNHALQLVFTDGMLPSLEKANLYIRNPRMQIAHRIFAQLQKRHNVQQMTMKCLYGLDRWDSVFSSCWQSLKHLTLVGYMKSDSVILPSVWDLPVLTTLNLKDVRFAGKTTTSVGLFSKCVNLLSLTISNFDMADETNIVTLCHPQLTNLTLEDGTWRSEYLGVVTPQLKNLTVRNCDGELLISAPDQLATLKYKSNYTLQLVFTDGELLSLEKVDLYIRNPHIRIAQRIFSLLQEFHNVRNLTLNLEIMEVLSSQMELISIEHPLPLVNVKSFNLYPLNANLARQAQMILNASTKLKSYLMDGSPNATSLMASLEDIIAWDNKKRIQHWIL